MLVTLRHTDSITLDLPVQSVSWPVSSAREFGAATVFVPRSSDGFGAAYINPDGGSLIDLHHDALGYWRGIVVRVGLAVEGALVEALHLSALTSVRIVSLSRQFTNHTAGAIVRTAVRDALDGLGRSVIRGGTFTESPPAIPFYEFRGQYLSEVLADLQDATGQEWRVDDDGALHWTPRRGSLYERWLAESGDVAEGRRQSDTTNRAVETVARDALGRAANALAADLAASTFWQRQALISAPSASQSAAGIAAETELGALRVPAVTFTLRLRRYPGIA